MTVKRATDVGVQFSEMCHRKLESSLMVAYFVGYPHSLHSTSDFPRDCNLSLTMTEREVIIKERKLARLKSGD